MKNYLISFPSKILGRKVTVRLLLPKENDLKCLILLHGYNGTHNQWIDKSPIGELAEKHGGRNAWVWEWLL